MRIYNVNTADMNARFFKAAAAGTVCAAALGIAYSVFAHLINIEFELIFIGIGWCVGTVIQKVGRGVGQRFQILAAVLTVLAVIIGDCCAYAGIGIFLNFPFQVLGVVLQSYASLNFADLIGLAFRIFAVITAYNTAVIF